MGANKNLEQRDLFPGALEMMVLQSLRRRPMHGYALVQHIKQESNELLLVEEGSLYPALQRLLKQDLVKAKWGISGTGRRVRTYRITRTGIKHLVREVSLFRRMLEGIALILSPHEL
jgi:PadR family transcriptional regulator, regulatory protein PadR